ncbi:non-specific lipid transfer protein GPI-anchored 1-like [Diospyros lotus]|uniref:non-specific lipid transfer protein GPI-anchored 1-like n=1 Tax=Diospyros lotus TaxID=55363 RepID=UPI002252961C|nr:non-specific lipid transfer protein GPI-anchored 1-like [Diospyros lotus]XP_052184390.1 non-specific lipid transfer protein GPI-anchored 1-like [Diospyros lotus]XP_052184391.1 non-specific lipid transfer protein GPI-anchored 1-like [Diospyros lotus]
MAKKTMASQATVWAVILLMMWAAVLVGGATLADKCSKDFEKVTACLNYATGKAATPSKDCCSAATEIKDSDPVCLCYIIVQVHNGSAQVKSLGIQESRLLQLPSACNLANASITECPKLLNIPASSPEYAIFTNASISSPTSPSTSSPGMVLPSTDSKSGKSKEGPPQLAAALVTIVATAVLFSAFPIEDAASVFYT